jgi:hypothetical protein
MIDLLDFFEMQVASFSRIYYNNSKNYGNKIILLKVSKIITLYYSTLSKCLSRGFPHSKTEK